MFRPYSLTSIAAWTVGSLAGNAAYYKAKQKGSFRISAAKRRNTLCPASDDAVIFKLKAIERQVDLLLEDCRIFSRTSGNERDMKYIVRFFAYEKWLGLKKQRILEELRSAHLFTIAESFESFAASISEIVNSFCDALEKMFSAECDSTARDQFVKLMNERQKLCVVCDLTYILTDSNTEDFVILINQTRDQIEKSRTITPTRPYKYTKDLYVARHSQVYGPYKYEQLLELIEAGNFSNEDLVAYDKARMWQPLGKLMRRINQRINSKDL